jgi:hypothetical protein
MYVHAYVCTTHTSEWTRILYVQHIHQYVHVRLHSVKIFMSESESERASEREIEARCGVRREANTAAQIKSAAVVWALKKTVSSSTSHPLHI